MCGKDLQSSIVVLFPLAAQCLSVFPERQAAQSSRVNASPRGKRKTLQLLCGSVEQQPNSIAFVSVSPSLSLLRDGGIVLLVASPSPPLDDTTAAEPRQCGQRRDHGGRRARVVDPSLRPNDRRRRSREQQHNGSGHCFFVRSFGRTKATSRG